MSLKNIVEKIQLEIQPRPIRFVYIVKNQQDLHRAVMLYSHLWGGRASSILPEPKNKEQQKEFKEALDLIAPDFIIRDAKKTTKLVQAVLKNYTGVIDSYSFAKLKRMIEKKSYVHYHHRNMPYMADILQNRMRNSEVQPKKLVTILNPLQSTSVLLQSGYISKYYLSKLSQSYTICQLRNGNNFEDQLKAQVSLAVSRTVLDLTTEQLRYSDNFDSFSVLPGLDSAEFVWIFLSDNNLFIEAAFWNISTFNGNKLLLEKEDFLKNIDKAIDVLIAVFTKLAHIVIVSPCSKIEAAVLQTEINSRLTKQNKLITVDILYDGINYVVPSYTVIWGDSYRRIIPIEENRLIDIKTPFPSGFEHSQLAFAFSASITYQGEHQFSLPDTVYNRELLTYGWNNIEWLRQRGGKMTLDRWFNYSYIRIVRGKIRGFTSYYLPNSVEGIETFYLPTNEEIFEYYLSRMNVRLQSNVYSRIVSVVLRKLMENIDSVDKDINLYKALAIQIKILTLLYNPKLKSSHEKSYNKLFTNRQINKIEESYFINLLQQQLIRRGYSVKCNNCNHVDWYSLEDIGEKVKCYGCGHLTQLALSYPFIYKLNEIVTQFFRTGGIAVLNTIKIFRAIGKEGCVEVGGELFLNDNKTAFADIDLWWLSKYFFAIAECKDWKIVGKDELIELEKSIEKNLKAANVIGADVLFVSIVCEKYSNKIFSALSKWVKRAMLKGIKLHLIINDDIYPFVDPNNPKRLGDIPIYNINPVTLPRTAINKTHYMGEKFRSSTIGRGASDYNKRVIAQYIRSLSLKS